MRLAVLLAALVVLAVVVVLLLRGCGGGGDEPDKPSASANGGATTAASAKATPKPKPVSTKPPLVSLGDVVRFETPEGAVIRVKVDDFQDPGQAPDGVSAEPGQRLVTLKLTVTPEGETGTAAVPVPFEVADSFILVMEDDELAAAMLGDDDDLLGAALSPGKNTTATLAFSVGASPPVRFVCKPEADTMPVSATWQLD
jgi:hypothetical protein